MPLVSVDSLATYLGVPDTEPGLSALLDRVEASTAARLGASSLAARIDIVESAPHELQQYNNGLSGGLYSANVYSFNEGPVTRLSYIKVNGVDVTADSVFTAGTWSVAFPAKPNSISFDVSNFDPEIWGTRNRITVEVKYDAGWATEYDLPAALKSYILLTAAMHHATPVAGMRKIAIGDTQVELSVDAIMAEKREAEMLINRYRRSFL